MPLQALDSPAQLTGQIKHGQATRRAAAHRVGEADAAPSVFRPENLPHEARRQRGSPDEAAPEVCALDPDGDIVRALRAGGCALRAAG
jgi:hypothetical protein